MFLETLEESGIIERLESFVNSRAQSLLDISDQQTNLSKLNSEVESIDSFVDDYLMKSGWIKKIKNFLFNDSFASYHRFRVEITNRYTYEEYSCESNDKTKIDMY